MYAFGNWNGSDRLYDVAHVVERWAIRLIFIYWIGNLVHFGIGVPCVVFWMCSRSGDVVDKEEVISWKKDVLY
jgi:hypothetical protein